ncbi:hypothetical protein [Paenilisteria newyorkensis]|uniref:hypothetical protein n=1 Tax=Listeria newyorkensis TaxID=1497681 RepID=UPI000669EAE5|nr:hypothetical protein [Listeria newyorkensis]KMT58919.1 hypothetical protein X559_2925 [Listeria newyorkensis]
MERWMLPEEEDMLLKVGVIRVSNSQKILCYRDSAGLRLQSYINMSDSTLKGLRVAPQKVKLPPVVAANIRDCLENNSELNANRGEALKVLLFKNFYSSEARDFPAEDKEIFNYIHQNPTDYCRAVLDDYEVEKTEMDCAVELFMDLKDDYCTPLTAVKVAGKSLPPEQHIDFIKRIAGELESMNLSEVDSNDSN